LRNVLRTWDHAFSRLTYFCYNLHPIVTHLKAHKGGLPEGEGEGDLPMTSSAFTRL